MVSIVSSANAHGLSIDIIKVEVDSSPGLPGFEMGGILSTEVRESKERVRVALRNSNYVLKPKKITVNLSPADIPKAGTGYDLAIAVGCLVSNHVLDMDRVAHFLEETLFVGELSLDGSIKPIKGVLPYILEAKKAGLKSCIVPIDNMMEGSVVDGINVYGAANLHQVVDFLMGDFNAMRLVQHKSFDSFINEKCESKELDFCEVIGQELAVRASLIAASGGHNILYIGPPGCGKTMMGARMSNILPHLSLEDSLEVSKIYSIAGLLNVSEGLITKAPCRSPHHTVSLSALMGGGRVPRPGEITLANHGILFLDELTEFSTITLEGLRQPLEDKKITLSRCGYSYVYPSRFMLVATMNPCKCGFYPDRNKCHCTEAEIRRFKGKISQPLMDRFDLSVQVSSIDYANMKKIQNDIKKDKHIYMDSKTMKEMVVKARQTQYDRYQCEKLNAELTNAEINKWCVLGQDEECFMEKVFEKMSLTMRGYNKILKVARTIADLEGEERINRKHLGEAVILRQ